MDFAEVIEHAVDVVRPSVDGRQLQLDVVLESRPLLLIGDPDRLQQLVWNLLSNAIKFSLAGGRVSVRGSLAGETIRLQVRDTGIGIDPRFLPHVFDRFRQADSSYTRESGGLGIGLSIVKSIAELHGGVVTAASSGVGRGAAFDVRLPVRMSRRAPRRAPRSTSRCTSASARRAFLWWMISRTNVNCCRRFSDSMAPMSRWRAGAMRRWR